MIRAAFTVVVLASVLLSAGCSQSGDTPKQTSSAVSAGAVLTQPLPAKAQCILQSPRLQVGDSNTLTLGGTTYTTQHQPDASGPIEWPLSNPGPQPAGSCQGNTQYRFGSGIYDITGPIGGNPTGHADLYGMILPTQVPNGINTRQYARAFAIQSPCNGKQVMFVSADLQSISALEHQELLKRIAADPQLSQLYTADNMMISATHTHEGDGGFVSVTSSTEPVVEARAIDWLEGLLISNPNYDDQNFQAILNGILQAMRRAQANLQVHADTAPIGLSVGELLNANVNRDPPAYQQNPPSELAQYVDANGHQVTVDKRVVQLNLVRADASAVGVINWFGVHPTSMGNHDRLMSSDNKGYASLMMERLFATQYVPDSNNMPTGADNFVAAFAQSDEGDSIPDLFVLDPDINGNTGPGQGMPYPERGGSLEPYDFDQPGYALGQSEATAISGTKQLAQALNQFAKSTALSGPVDYRFFYAQFDDQTITDPVVLDGLVYADEPADLYTPAKSTCARGVGIGVSAGGINGVDPGAAGFACVADAPIPYLNQIRTQYNGLYNGTGYIVVDGHPVPVDGVRVIGDLAPLLCRYTQVPANDYGCQLEKPVVASGGIDPVPLQIFRIGNLAILGVPWEVTTMSGRRLRKTVLDALSPVGVDTVVIAGLSNGYLSYMATREEYTAQMFEAAFTLSGPWQLGMVQQQMRALALTMANGSAAPASQPPQDIPADGPVSPTTIDLPAAFGTVLTDAQASYAQGQAVSVSFIAGFPGNDLKTQASYLYVEHQNADGSWSSIAEDHDPELTFLWNSDPHLSTTLLGISPSSSATAVWSIPADTSPGTYRIRHEGVYRLNPNADPVPYSGVSREFQVAGAAQACP